MPFEKNASTAPTGFAADSEKHPHTVQFYSDPSFLLDALSRFIGSALGAGDAAIVIATEEHRTELARRLVARGLELQRAVEQGRYVALHAGETLSRFMVDDWPDETRFVELIGGVISRAKSGAEREHGRAALFGEMVALLWAEGKVEAALRLEQLWNQIAQAHSFSLLCAYPLSKFYREAHQDPFLRICDEHSSILPAESYALASEDERLRLVAQWQQKAMVLETEAARNRELQEAAAKLAAIVTSSEDAIVSKDLNGIVTSWNTSAERIFGYQAEEIIGKPILTIIPPELHSDEDMILGKIRRDERIEHFETVRLAKNGRRIDVSLTISPVKNDAGEIIGAAKVARDITQQKRSAEALKRVEKLAVAGRMAATIAHEINNPLAAVTNLLFLLRSHMHSEEGLRQLALAESELDRVSHLAKQTLSFYRDSVAIEPVNLTELIDSVLTVFAKKIAQKRLMVVRSEETCLIHGLKGALRQLVSNVIDNAIEAAPTRGKIETLVRSLGPEVLFSIADNGPGIAAEIQCEIFEPFYTTKEFGTGLGLWVAREVAQKHGGRIEVESNTHPECHGSVFRTILSAKDDSVQAASAAGRVDQEAFK